ncbi:TPA: amidase [Burkholderia vietnamiensis]|uniref:amidase n=1 Tax=Burkholderia vietnamiensis TaxID=60552 RepID=UPI001CF1F4FE|nr:amidase [Burkholderia vietnamiensis]MCA8267925.1 amidase [Burkholderia vietnamiensis]UKV72929.1 amidase [Burkholderia vietnamiensis]HDR8925556.1 amidase [Burkholderia vietnamiensis]HDR9214030.1 amidase [Burkholderia vietnamiensis]HDR9267261.1 amidase [Burkholderia vietnamiensis]
MPHGAPYLAPASIPVDPLVRLPAGELASAIRRKAVSCVETMRAYLDHIERVNGAVNALISLRDRATLLAEAAEKDAALARGEYHGWLHGMPQAPKDLAMTKGLRTTYGSPIFRDHVPQADSIGVGRMRAAGAIFIGKTNTPEFGLGSHTFNDVHGATRNPYDLTRSAGGSSGGSAAALAARMLPVADGSDFGGSLRNPAAFCNVYGMRPSQGRVPRWPAVDVFMQQLGTEGPMGRTVGDVAQLLAIQAGYDANDPLSLAEQPLVFATPLDTDLRGRRIAWVGDWDGYLATEPGVLAQCEQGLATLREIGCDVDAALPAFAPERIWRLWLAHRHLLAGGGLLAHYRDPARRALLKPEAIYEVEGLLAMGGAAVFDASVERTAWHQAVLRFFDRYDFIAAPSAQVFPFDVELRWPQAIAGRPMDTYHRWMETVVPWTLAGCPVISVPVGFNDDGLPMGMQLIGRPRADLAVLQLARGYEQAADWVGRRLPGWMAA